MADNTVTNYKQLRVWQQGLSLCKEIYLLTKTFPSTERFCLVDQMRRCSISVPSNIAEGYGRYSQKDFLRFLRISYASLAELETQLLIAHDLKYIAKTKLEEVIVEIIKLSKMLNKLMRSIKEKC